jgi:hypothetical protein
MNPNETPIQLLFQLRILVRNSECNFKNTKPFAEALKVSLHIVVAHTISSPSLSAVPYRFSNLLRAL